LAVLAVSFVVILSAAKDLLHPGQQLPDKSMPRQKRPAPSAPNLLIMGLKL
jgi:hypothetical protein